jgi:antitoxin component YwqK of YwqJK toxin-antitoxin module
MFRLFFSFIFCFSLLISCQHNSPAAITNDTVSSIAKIPDTLSSPAAENPEETAVSFYDLSDDILLCHEGAFPFYVSCEDSVCAETLFYSNRKVKAIGKCVNGKKSGLWTSYFENGNVRSKGMIKNGFPLGQWVFYYRNGNRKAEGEFISGQFELGCAGSGNFRNVSVFNGEWNCWFEDGKMSASCTFKPNVDKLEKMNGLYTEWFSNGKKKEEGMYRNGEKNQQWTYWYENGNKKREENYKYQDCGLYDYISFECPTGKWNYWNEDGSLLKTEVYVDGVKTDEQ